MIIDVHTHIGMNEHINSSVDNLLLSMDKSKIDKALVFAGEINGITNSYMLEQIALHKDRLYGVAAYHPDNNYNDLHIIYDSIDNEKAVAVKFYLGYDHWYPNDHKIYEILEHLDRKGSTAIFHCGDCLNTVKKAKLKYSHPLGIDDPAVDYPNLNIVIAHMGFPWHRDTAEVCYKNKNVYADISGFVYGDFDSDSQDKFRKVISEFTDICPADKLLFGTDFPISNQDSYIATVFDMELESIFNNANKAFNLK
jgi:uncharacterized protein